MKKQKNNRGFNYLEFEDRNGIKCNIQESSIATEDCIWLGADEIGLKRFAANIGWKDVTLVDTIQDHYVANNRMHLNKAQAEEIIKVLEVFVKSGNLRDCK